MLYEIIKVETCSGYKQNERPVRLFYQKKYWDIDEILDRWYESDKVAGGPVFEYYKVNTEQGREFILRHNTNKDVWSVLLA